jgi:sec-independent protein translocase protein TatC
MAFAYFVVFPLVFAFFTATTPEGVAQMPDIAFYLEFVLKLFFAFGIAFEIPIATILLVAMGITTAESLTAKRPYIIVGVFVVGMLLTPPDVISQTLLAIPMWLLYEAGIFFSRFFKSRNREEGETEDGSPGPVAGVGLVAAGAGLPRGEGLDHPGGLGGVGPSAPAADFLVGRDISGGDPFDRERFVPLTPEEMEAELDAIEAAEAALDDAEEGEEEDEAEPAAEIDPIDALLERVRELRDLENEAGARQLLYRVLADGNESQRGVAMNILTEMDMP